MSVCAVCGSSDFGDPQDGLFFCLECGTQSQDVREEVSQLEDRRGRYTRTLRTKKGKSKKAEAEETDHSLPLETFQRVIRRQCDALVALGFNPSLKEAARLIWFTYLRHYGYAFREEGRSVSGRTKSKIQFTPSSSSPLPSSSSQPPPSGSGSSQFDCGVTSMARVRGRKGRKRQKRPVDSDSTESSSSVAKKAKVAVEKSAGYDTFPDDKFLFEDTEKEEKIDESKSARKFDLSQGVCETLDSSVSVRIMENVTTWEGLEELEAAMDCRQLLAFRQAYLSAHGERKPKFVDETESWKYQPRVFKLRHTVSVLYLALLYTEQPVLPADLTRWVKSEKIPLHTPLEDDNGSENKDNRVFFTTMQSVTTAALIENSFRLYLHLPLPPLPSPDPRAISHIIIDRLRFTECLKRLVDRAMATVYLPLGFTGRRMDLECAAVVVIMLRILYGLDDHMELEEPPICDANVSGDGGQEDLTGANSLPLWVDWVKVYSRRVSSALPLDGDVPTNHLEPRSYHNYLKFCRETIFSRCRSTPAPGSKSFQRFEPAFNQKISRIFASVSKIKSAADDTKLTFPSSPLPGPSSAGTKATDDTPRLVHISHFITDPKAPCTVYRPLPTSHKWHEDLKKTQLSHSMRFLLSAVCDIIHTTPRNLYTVLLVVDMAFVDGIAVKLRNIATDFLSKKK